MAKEMIGGCCVCSDERGWAENPLVYCDGHGCNVAVHQACYGIVTVPTGPWFCRKCESQERAARVRCELCPHREGALKRTDNGGWAHVVCALYIPEVRFGNVTTMEPILLSMVPHERYNKLCYICEQQHRESKASTGACMTCNKNGCRQSFHVTCAQMQGLLCEEAGQFTDNVKYCGYCEYHYNKLVRNRDKWITQDAYKHKKDKDTIKTIPAFKHHYTTTPEKEKIVEKKHEKHKQRKKHASSTEASVITQTEYEKTKSDVSENNSLSGDNSLKCLEETAAKFTSANFKETEFTSNKPIVEPNVPHTDIVVAPAHKTKKHSGQRGRKPSSSRSLLSESISTRSESPCSTASQPDLPGLGLPEINANAAEHRATPSDDGSSTKSKTKSLARSSSKEPSREPTPSRMPSVTTETIEQKDLPPAISTSTPTPPPISVDTTIPMVVESSNTSPKKTYESSYHDFMSKYSQSTGAGIAVNTSHIPTKESEPTVSPITIVKSPDKHDKKKHRVKKNKGHPGRPKNSAKTVKDLIKETSQPSPTKKSRKSSSSSLNSSLNTLSSSMNINPVNEISSANSAQFPPHLIPQGSPVRLPNSNLAMSQSSTSSLAMSGLSASQSMSGSMTQSLFSNQIGNSQMPALTPENSDSATNHNMAESGFRDVFNTAATNGLLVGPQRHSSLHGNTTRNQSEQQDTVPPFPATMEELLERQWEQGSEFLMQQGVHFDIASLLSCLHQLRAENHRLEEHVKNLVARRDHLLAVNARLSVPLANATSNAGSSTENSPSMQSNRSPRLNNMIHPEAQQAQDMNTSHGSLTQSNRSPGSLHSTSPGQANQATQLPVGMSPSGTLTQIPTTPPHPQNPSLHPQPQGGMATPRQHGNIQPGIQHSHGHPSVSGQYPDGRLNMPSHLQESPPESQRYRDQHGRESSKEQHREHQRHHIMLQQQQLTQEQHQQLVYQLMHQQQSGSGGPGLPQSGSGGPGLSQSGSGGPGLTQSGSGGSNHMSNIQTSPGSGCTPGNGAVTHTQSTSQGGRMPSLQMNGEHSTVPPENNLSHCKVSQGGKKGNSCHSNKS